MSVWLLCICLLAVEPEPDDVLPKPSDKGVADLQALMQQCIEGGALKFVPRTKAGPSRIVLADAARLKQVLDQHARLLSPELCDTLLTTSRAFDQAALLTAVAQHKQDPRMLAFAALARAGSYRAEGNLPSAVQEFADADARFGALKSTWQATSLIEWAAALLAQGEFDEAQVKQTQAIVLLRQRRGPYWQRNVANGLKTLAAGYVVAERDAAALEALDEALHLQEQTNDTLPEEFIKTHRDLADVLLRQGDSGAALSHLSQALELTEQVTDERRRLHATAQVANSLGHALQSLGQTETALRFFEQSLEEFQRYDPKPNSDTAATLNYLGMLYYKLGMASECIGLLRRSLGMLVDLYGDRDERIVQSRLNLGHAHQRFEQYISARESFAEAQRVARLIYGPRHALVAASQLGLAEVALELNDNHQAQTLARSAVEILALREAQQQRSLSQAWGCLGRAEHRLGRFQESAAALRSAWQFASSSLGERHPVTVTALRNLATAFEQLGRQDDALRLHEQALAMRQAASPRSETDVADSLNALGSLWYDRGDYARAAEYHDRAADVYRRLPRVSRGVLVAALNNLAMSHYGLRQWTEAIRIFDEALSHLRIAPPKANPPADSLEGRYGYDPDNLTPLRTTVQVLLERGMAMTMLHQDSNERHVWTDIMFNYTTAINVLERWRIAGLESESGRLDSGNDLADIFPLLVGCAARIKSLTTGSHETLNALAFGAAEMSSARAMLRSLAQSRAALLADLPEALRVEADKLAAEQASLDRDLLREQSQPGLERDFERVAALMTAQRQLKGRQQAWREAVDRQHPRFAELQHPATISLADARRLLGGNEVALLYVCGSAASYVVAISRDERGPDGGVTIHAIPREPKLAEMVAAATDLRFLQRGVTADSVLVEAYRALLAPVEAQIQGRDLLIVATGSASLLPLEMLVERFDRETGRPMFVVESRVLRYASSLSVSRLLQDARTRRRPPTQALWAIGDPLYPSLTAPESSPAGLALPRLPRTADEIQGVATLLDAPSHAVLLGGQATEAAVKKASHEGRLGAAKYLHFAVHGVLNGQAIGQPALILGRDDGGADDGYLQLDEVARLTLNADLVVLSACQTGLGRVYEGEGAHGLARAFLHAGAQGVVCSLWSVPDESTAAFMQDFYRRLALGVPATRALQETKLALLRDEQPPLAWAPFVLIGDAP